MKIFAGLGGRPMLAHVLERAKAIQGVERVVLAVPHNDVRLVSHLWPHVFGGSEKDVLERYSEAADHYEADVIVRITGDCPLLAPDLIADALTVYGDPSKLGRGYLAMCQPYTPVADGWDAEIFDEQLLEDAAYYAIRTQHEHVTTWMRLDGAGILSFPEWTDHTALKCSVDTREDLQRVQKIYECLDDKADFSHTATWQAWEKAGRP
jgi:glutamate-1-semialdehyde 2,1-aminomutase